MYFRLLLGGCLILYPMFNTKAVIPVARFLWRQLKPSPSQPLVQPDGTALPGCIPWAFRLCRSHTPTSAVKNKSLAASLCSSFQQAFA